MEKFYNKLEKLKQKCAIKNSEYWDLKLKDDEIPIYLDKKFYSNIYLQTKNNRIEILLEQNDKYELIFYTEIYIFKKDLHPLFVFLIEKDCSCKWMNPYFDNKFNIELFPTIRYNDYFCFHIQPKSNINFALPFNRQQPKGVFGPIQFLQFARDFINFIYMEESKVVWKYKKHVFTNIIILELFEKVFHPQKIYKWLQLGFDPFE
jgi:hypothetical protein